MSYNYETLKELSLSLWVQSLLFNMASTEHKKEAMEIIFLICVTGLGIFGGMFFIWKGHYSSSSKAHHSSRTS
jgi:hypothetical protein